MDQLEYRFNNMFDLMEELFEIEQNKKYVIFDSFNNLFKDANEGLLFDINISDYIDFDNFKDDNPYLNFEEDEEINIKLISNKRNKKIIKLKKEFKEINKPKEIIKENEKCPICMDEAMHDIKKCTLCNVYYHKECIKEWLKVHPKCPHCRASEEFKKL